MASHCTLYFAMLTFLEFSDFRWAGAGQSDVSGGKRKRHITEAEMTGDGAGGWLDEGGGEPGSSGSNRAGRMWDGKEGQRDGRGWGDADGGRKVGGEGRTKMDTRAALGNKVSVHTCMTWLEL